MTGDAPAPVRVLGFPVRPLRTEQLIELLISRAAASVRTSAAYLNAHTCNRAAADPRLADALRACDVLYADGMSVVWAARLLGRPLPERMTSADYFPRFAARCAAEGLSLFLLGGAPDVARRAAEFLRCQSPDLRIAGLRDGYFADAESPAVAAAINAARPDVLVLGLGSPRQETWMHAHRDDLDAPVVWCVGGLFNYLAGDEPRAPRWLCRIGGEWLFRLLVDPAGKWRRYLVGNPRFVARVLLERLRPRRPAD